MKWLITGGAGFIGSSAAKRLIRDGHGVVIFDDFSRRGSEINLQWLHEAGKAYVVKGDTRSFTDLRDAFQSHRDIDVVLHLAAQVAVTTSVVDPRADFEVNALGTFNVCEAVRRFAPNAILLNASTNKVYGTMADVKIALNDGHYEYVDLPHGVSEDQPLEFHSPYGCSKGSGDQYVKDYAAIYNLRSVNFRQSCIYGPRQFGIEDQGWVAWFAISAVAGRPINIYGDGKQVRDILFVDDLVECYVKAVERIHQAQGRSYNIGGGPNNTVSLLELIHFLSDILGARIKWKHSDWRPGDQKIFIADIRRAKQDLDWEPKVQKSAGIKRLVEWVVSNQSILS